MTWQAEVPFNNMSLLPPSIENVESINILKACIPARSTALIWAAVTGKINGRNWQVPKASIK